MRSNRGLANRWRLTRSLSSNDDDIGPIDRESRRCYGTVAANETQRGRRRSLRELGIPRGWWDAIDATHAMRLQLVPQIGAAAQVDAQQGQTQQVSVCTHQPQSLVGNGPTRDRHHEQIVITNREHSFGWRSRLERSRCSASTKQSRPSDEHVLRQAVPLEFRIHPVYSANRSLGTQTPGRVSPSGACRLRNGP